MKFIQGGRINALAIDVPLVQESDSRAWIYLANPGVAMDGLAPRVP